MPVTHNDTAYGDANLYNLGSSSPLTAADVLIKTTSTPTRIEAFVPRFGVTFVAEGNFKFNPVLTDGSSATGLATKVYIYSKDGLLEETETWTSGWEVSDYSVAYALSSLAGEDAFIGSATSGNRDQVQGLGGNDRFTGYGDSSSGDLFFGGDGIDTSIYRGKMGEYTIARVSDIPNAHWEIPNAPKVSGFRVTDKIANRDGIDSLNEVERLQFSDVGVAFDSAKGENAGQAYRLYKAAFDRAPDQPGLGYWISEFDKGAWLTGVASSFIASPEFTAMYGANSTDTNFVKLLYNHVLHRDPDLEGYAYWLKELDHGMSRGGVLASFSESPENAQQTAQLIANGIQYQVWQA